MKRFLMALAALCFVMAASLAAGCSHTDRCGVDFCVCEGTGEGVREMDAPAVPGTRAEADTDSDLVRFDNGPDPVDDIDADAGDSAPAPVQDKYAVADDVFDAPEAEEDFSEEAMTQRIREFEASGRNETEIVRDIIDEGYDEVPTVTAAEPPVEIEILPEEEAVVPEPEPAAGPVIEPAPEIAEEAEEAPVDVEVVAEEPLREMAADYQAYLDIEAYEPASEEPAAPAAPVVEDVAEEPVAVVEEAAALLPPPLEAAPEAEPGAVEFGAGAEPASAPALLGGKQDLSLEGFDDMDLEYFGAISESLLEDGGEG